MNTEPTPTPVPGPRSAGAATVLACSRVDFAATLAESPSPRTVVITTGVSHKGRFDLVRKVAWHVGPAGTVVVTIFVNPLQFAPTEDLDAYPRDLEGNLTGLTRTLTGTDGALGAKQPIAFALTPEIICPSGQPAVRIDPGPTATVLKGRTRPIHSADVCRVVLTLVYLTALRQALLDRKDAQQLTIIEFMVYDLAVPLEIVPVDTRCEDDSLTMSSRSAYLSPEQRHRALALSHALQAGRDITVQAAGTRPDPTAIRQATLASLETTGGIETDYVALVAPDSFENLAGAGLDLPHSESAGKDEEEGLPAVGLLAVATHVGAARLVDNALINLRP